MIKIGLTGATGFIGRPVLDFLQTIDGVETVCLGRNEAELQSLNAPYVVHDIGHPQKRLYEQLGAPDLLIHLAWEGLPNYDQPFHMLKNLPHHIHFLKQLIDDGLKNITVAGTCFEYGLQYGCLNENLPANPTNHYALAKDTLRKFLELYSRSMPVRLRWARLFYVFGRGQSRNSLLPMIDIALEGGVPSFDMTGGEQLRDYLPVREMAALMVKVALQDQIDGIINICSGKPISIRRLVERHLEAAQASMRVNLGAIPYPDHESMAFWGDVNRLNTAIEAYEITVKRWGERTGSIKEQGSLTPG